MTDMDTMVQSIHDFRMWIFNPYRMTLKKKLYFKKCHGLFSGEFGLKFHKKKTWSVFEHVPFSINYIIRSV